MQPYLLHENPFRAETLADALLIGFIPSLFLAQCAFCSVYVVSLLVLLSVCACTSSVLFHPPLSTYLYLQACHRACSCPCSSLCACARVFVPFAYFCHSVFAPYPCLVPLIVSYVSLQSRLIPFALCFADAPLFARRYLRLYLFVRSCLRQTPIRGERT